MFSELELASGGADLSCGSSVHGDMGCPTLSQSLCLSLEELPRPTGGPITGLSSLQFIVRMAYVILAVRKERT